MNEQLREKTSSFLANLSVDSFSGLADSTIRQAFEEIVESQGGDAGAIWIVEPAAPEKLVIAVNVGSRGSSIEGEVSQSVDSGLVSKAIAKVRSSMTKVPFSILIKVSR